MNQQVKLLQLEGSKYLLTIKKLDEQKKLQAFHLDHDHDLKQWLKEQQFELLNQIDINCSIPDNIPGDAYQNRFSDYSPLHLVAKMGSLDLVNELIKHGANVVKQESHNQNTPLHIAIGNIDYDKKMIHFSKEILDLVDALLSAQIQADNAINPKCSDGISHFHIACLFNHTTAVNFFINNGELIDQVTNRGLTPLHCAIKSSSFDAVKILLTNGANMNLKDSNGASSLVLLTELLIEANDLMTVGIYVPSIVYQKDIKEIEFLFIFLFELKMNYPTFFDNSELTIVHVACMLENKSILKNCLKKGFNSNIALPRDSKFWPGWTPLHFAACCNVESIDLLLQYGANINAKNEEGETPLDSCLMRYAPRIVKKILSRRDEFKNIIFSDGSTKLLDLLHAMNSHDKLKKLLNSLSSVNISLPLESVIWPGFSILHLSVLMNEKTKEFHKYSYLTKLDMLNSKDEKHYNCTEYEIALYMKRIERCLEKGCDVSMKNANGLTPIHLAFRLQKYKVANELLEFCQVDAVDPNGLSHFHIACALENQNAVERLLSKGVDVNNPVKSSFEWFKENKYSNATHFSMKAQSTPIHIVVTLKNNKLVQCLVEHGADVFAKDHARGLTTIHLSMYSNRNLAKWLLNKALKDFPASKKVVSPDGFSYLFIAAYANDDKAIESLRESGERVDVVWPMDLDFFPDNAGLTPLHVAVNMNSDKAVRALIKAAANIFAENPNREHDSPLQRAFNNKKLFKYFVQKLRRDGTSITPLDSSGLTQLHVACNIFHLDWAKELLKMGADVNAIMLQPTDENDKTVLRLTPLCAVVVQAVKVVKGFPRNFMDLLQLLIENGADVTIDYVGMTPLHHVHSQYRSKLQEQRYERERMTDYYNYHYPSSSDTLSDVTEVVHEMEDEFSETDGVGSTAIPFFEIAITITDLLLTSQKSYDINPTTKEGFSHFHYACLRNKVDIVKKFLDNGVDVNRMTSFFADEKPGYSPLHFAFAYHCEKVASLLIESGADVKAEDAEGNTPLHIAIIRKFINLPLLDKLLRQGIDINAKNIAGETPMGLLLNQKGLTLESLDFFNDRGATIEVSNSDAAIKLFDTAIKSAKPNDVVPVFKMLLKACDHIELDIKSSFNAIHSVVSVYDENRTLDFYLDAIKQFMELGFELDWQDESGETALYKASTHYVAAVAEALLILGADINIVNQCGRPPLTPNDVKTCDDEENSWYFGYRPEETVEKLVAHAYKMKLIKLDVLDSIANAVEVEAIARKPQYSYMNENFVDEHICQNELKKIENTKIGKILPLKNFLSEWGAVIDYTTMPFTHREIIDKYFMDTDGLRKEFPQFCGLLMMQYRKALKRVELIDFAKHVLISECEFDLPDLCLEAIFRYFKNSDLRILTAPDECDKRGKVATRNANQHNPENVSHEEFERLVSISVDDNDDKRKRRYDDSDSN